MLFVTDFDEWCARYTFIHAKHPDYPVRYYEDENGITLYIADDDGFVMAARKERASWRSREEQQTFQMDVLDHAVRVLNDPSAPEPPNDEDEADEPIPEFDSTFIGPI